MRRWLRWGVIYVGISTLAVIVPGQTPKAGGPAAQAGAGNTAPAPKTEKDPVPVSVVSPAAAPTTGPAAQPLAGWEVEVLRELNFARSEPQKIIALLEEYKTYYQGKELRVPGASPILTLEGVEAVDDAINYLKALKPLPAYQLSPAALSAARAHVDDLIAHNSTGHKGSDGSLPGDRVSRYGLTAEDLGEDIYYGAADARRAILWLIIDDGSKTRLHRRNIFNPGLNFVGLASSVSKDWGRICVLTFVDQAGPATGDKGAQVIKP